MDYASFAKERKLKGLFIHISLKRIVKHEPAERKEPDMRIHSVGLIWPFHFYLKAI